MTVSTTGPHVLSFKVQRKVLAAAQSRNVTKPLDAKILKMQQTFVYFFSSVVSADRMYIQ